jgi:NADH-quinone oxidoreductase subunit L
MAAVARFWLEGWRFDRLYAWLVVRPWYWLTRDAADRIDRLYGTVAQTIAWLHVLLSRTQTGHVRWYAASVAMGALVLIGWIAL